MGQTGWTSCDLSLLLELESLRSSKFHDWEEAEATPSVPLPLLGGRLVTNCAISELAYGSAGPPDKGFI